MAERYPGLSERQLVQLDVIGRRFIKPPIRHGAGHSAGTRDAHLADRVEAEIERTSA
jgi:hypothetical protein